MPWLHRNKLENGKAQTNANDVKHNIQHKIETEMNKRETKQIET